jgi:hypothetical protein
MAPDRVSGLRALWMELSGAFSASCPAIATGQPQQGLHHQHHRLVLSVAAILKWYKLIGPKAVYIRYQLRNIWEERGVLQWISGTRSEGRSRLTLRATTQGGALVVG